jgi:hypothetical protein
MSYGQGGEYASSSQADPLQFYDGNSMYGPRPGHTAQNHVGGGYASSSNYGGGGGGMAMETSRLDPGWIKAFGTGGYDGEPPLLEELGINFTHIKMKTLTVLNPLAKVDQHIMDDSDLAGPILFCLLFGTFLLLSGKIHFGYVYGVALLGSASLHLIFGLMAPHSVSFSRSASILGYCMLPLVFTSAIGVGISMDSITGYFLATLSVVWCTYSASAIFVAVLQMTDMRFLVAYPLALLYSIFALMTIFAEKNSKLGVR